MNEGRDAAFAGPTSQTIFHVHPLQRCNLACLHCYSDSSPAATAMLSLSQLRSAVHWAADCGYKVLSVSGGEPLLYPQLSQLLQLGRECGMATAVVTNGLLLERAGALEALRRADTVAVSVDGLSNTHDQMRGRPRAFHQVLAALGRLRGEGIAFAINCGVTPSNLGELDELAAAVLAAGASALQLHPVEASGRANSETADLVLDDEAATAFYVLAHLLKVEYAGRLTIAVDALHRETLLAQPHMLYGRPAPVLKGKQDLADNVGVLVLDPFGNLMPIAYGFAKPLWLGNLEDDLGPLCRRYLAEGGEVHKLYALGQRTSDKIARGLGPDVFNPSDVLARASHRGLVAIV